MPLYLLAGPTTDRPKAGHPLPEPTDQQMVAFFGRIGKAVAAWQFIESLIVIIFVRAIGAGNLDALAGGYYASTGFATRLKMVDAAVKGSHFSDPLKARWAKLWRKINDKSLRRNKLAHSVVVFMPSRGAEDRQLFLATKFDWPRPTTFGQRNIITQSDLEDMIKVFDELHRELTLFHLELPVFKALKASPP
jgi:hypothetical protein